MTETPQWLDDDAGPVVRPYALIRGRTRSSGDMFDLIATVRVVDEPPGDVPSDLGPEQQTILRMARSPISVADVASELDLPIGVIRVLLGDMRDHGLISVTSPSAARPRPSSGILKEVINGLRAL
ncbi:DUF742 domain-containing protein [Nonomuraea muscovyensis]|uniref:Putative Rossmann fold nucleotide-binding protein DprA/Smf involved in DNA uptake n=1 Tax=Nonomuraea muscovyensis TaxID=1124761 RepID=A0A7X0C0X1_9ACTN|nr:DUF742 domain-containing protein [Nonomuraea muscovyensis]MBB6346482.1 putative Rossmann fold nucleotide-binding protein DprA/Smf involved in DNA uptake [Nonomuraea muscovyensis]MDF2708369.1 hypothetical protein [Nonomuraea muscovyensis]